MKLLPLLFALCLLFSCKKEEDDCNNTATITFFNNTLGAVVLQIDNTSHGTLQPAGTKEIKLSAGTHQIKGLPVSGAASYGQSRTFYACDVKLVNIN